MENNNTNKNQQQNMEGLNITDEQLQKLIQSETDKVRTNYSKQVKDLEGKITEYEEKQKEYEQKEKYYKTIDVLKENNIPSQLAKWIDIDIENEEEINELKKVFKNNKDTGYKPQTQRKDDDYSKAEKEGNVQGMISNKLGRLFQ
ncbi:hypothetical protein [Sporanaerobacter acetigenes]|uniref:Phage minor structural protein GP20 n=1 Tax=Sporanaerobacter acetigenes DSM 13106 TaxID=1123281 RepID=A0A1M5RZQ9_9FIRM|nr:hypothetical protein [Sporanaerobacter acetigenes]SHH31675.1 hypothetical protein SAMN02745180_00028 [Sporanaerobacter acetigenes DSM 13106]